jgi:hypothetical protein
MSKKQSRAGKTAKVVGLVGGAAAAGIGLALSLLGAAELQGTSPSEDRSGVAVSKKTKKRRGLCPSSSLTMGPGMTGVINEVDCYESC